MYLSMKNKSQVPTVLSTYPALRGRKDEVCNNIKNFIIRETLIRANLFLWTPTNLSCNYNYRIYYRLQITVP